MLKGKVKSWFPLHQNGFIIPDDGGPDVFFHTTVCDFSRRIEPEPGWPVRYRVKFGTTRAYLVQIDREAEFVAARRANEAEAAANG